MSLCVCEWALLGSVMIDSCCQSCGWPENLTDKMKNFFFVGGTPELFLQFSSRAFRTNKIAPTPEL